MIRPVRRRLPAAVAPVGAALLGASFRARPGSQRFYATTLGTAAVWTVGAAAAGLRSGDGGQARLRHPVLTPVATGVGAFAVFAVGAAASRRLGILDREIDEVFAYAEHGDPTWVLLTTLANGIGEEMFFRGATYSALAGHRPVVASSAAYTLVTASTRNPALVAAAAVMGTLFALQRRAGGGVQAPLITHLTWSTLMVRVLPRLLRRAG